MSLINPESRWWNRDATRKGTAYVLWTAAITLALFGTWGLTAGEESPVPVWLGILGAFLPIPLIVGGSFLISFGTVDGFDSRTFVWVLALYFIATGAGALIGEAMSSRPTIVHGDVTFAVFIVGGVLAILVYEWLRLRSRRATALREAVQRIGVDTSGTVTRARHYWLNHRSVTKVTVQFTDSDGRKRWSSTSVEGTVNQGQSVRVRYSQEHLRRSGAVIVTRPGRR